MAVAAPVEVQPPKIRNDLLQEFRGLAAVLVLLYHAHDTFLSPRNLGTSYNFCGGIFRAGYSAVDFFFVLSGFLMVHVHRREEGQPAFRKLFFLKRFLRIYPPYWGAVAILYPLWMFTPRLNGVDRDLSGGKLLETILLTPQGQSYLISPAWSLTYEVFFYLIFGLVFFLRRGAFATLGVAWFAAVVAAYASPAVGSYLGANEWLGVAFGTRNVGFLGGCLVGYLAAVLSPRIKIPTFWIGLAGLVTIWALDIVDDRRTSLATFTFAYAAASSLIVLGSTAVNLGRRGWMILLGDASYSIYITHMAGMALMVRVGLKLGLAQRIGLFATSTTYVLGTIGVGVAFHFAAERPLMAVAKKIIARVKRPTHAVPIPA